MFESLVVQRQHFAFLQSFQSQWDNFELFMFPLTHSKITYLLPDNRNPELWIHSNHLVPIKMICMICMVKELILSKSLSLTKKFQLGFIILVSVNMGQHCSIVTEVLKEWAKVFTFMFIYVGALLIFQNQKTLAVRFKTLTTLSIIQKISHRSSFLV